MRKCLSKWETWLPPNRSRLRCGAALRGVTTIEIPKEPAGGQTQLVPKTGRRQLQALGQAAGQIVAASNCRGNKPITAFSAKWDALGVGRARRKSWIALTGSLREIGRASCRERV